jgi:uncharacterized Fe-S center protein
MAKVVFSDFRIQGQYNLLDKMEKMVNVAGIADIDFTKKYVAIKIHFGEPGNMAFLRPNWAARMAKIIKELGGKPFLTDCATLYSGRRSNAIDHLESAFENGFSPQSAGCPVIIADGLKGTDYREIPLGLKHYKSAKIGSAIADADIVISMNHFKGHELAGFGGALKNLGMGSGSVGGKLEMHSQSKPHIIRESCTGCRACVKNCAHDAVRLDSDKRASIDYDKCVGCGQCVAVCMYQAAAVNWNEVSMGLNEKVAEYTMAALKGKPSFHVNFINQVSPNCDCWNTNDVAIVPDLGMMASTDPVAIDRACADMVIATPPNPQSVLAHLKPGEDKFAALYPNTNWRSGLEYAETIGLGSQNYDLLNLDK